MSISSENYSKTPAYTKLISHIRHRRSDQLFMETNINPFVVSDDKLVYDQYKITEGLAKEELSHALVIACISGDLPVAKAIWREEGPFENKFEIRDRRYWLNGIPFVSGIDTHDYLRSSPKINQLSEIFEWMPSAGLGFLCGINSNLSLLLDSEYIGNAINTSKIDSFEGDLPVFNGGKISKPELLIAMADKRKKSFYKDSFGQILCWATREMIEAFPDDLSTFDRNQYIECKGPTPLNNISHPMQRFELDGISEDVIRRLLPVKEFQADTPIDDNALMLKSINLNTRPSKSRTDVLSYILMERLATREIQFGFNHNNDLTLCRASLDFLQRFDAESVDELSLSKCYDFCSEYFPLDMILFHYDKEGNFDARSINISIGLEINGADDSVNLYRLYRELQNYNQLQLPIKNLIPRSLFDYLMRFKQTIPVIQHEALLGLYHAFGVDNSDFMVSLKIDQLEHLHRIGFVFSEGTVCYRDHAEYSAAKSDYKTKCVIIDLDYEFRLEQSINFDRNLERYRKAYETAIKMNLWPAPTKKPSSLEEAIKMMARKSSVGNTPHDKSLMAYLMVYGVDKCVSTAKTAAQWRGIIMTFGREMIEPHLEKAPSNIKGILFENDLGL